MTITNFSPPERANGAGDIYANNLAIFGQEVLADYKDRNLMSNLIRKSTIKDSKTKQFDRIGNVVSAYHVKGAEVLGDSILANKIDISVDDRPILGSVFMDDAEHILSHYDERAPYAAEISRSISDTIDARILQVLVNASKASAPVTGGPTGGSVIVANADSDSSVLIAELFTARSAFAENSVPLSGLMCAVEPAVFHLLAQENTVINKDLNVGSNGGTDMVREAIMIAGITVVMTNHLPSGVVASDPLDGNVYAGTFTDLVAVVWDRNAAMSVEAMPLTTGTDGYTELHQGTIIVGKTLQGTGVLRNENAYSIFHL